jgi:glycosyltransferase involved in cell wall biosynthesis
MREMDAINTHSNKRIKVCYVLSYRLPNYPRTKTLTGALKKIDGVSLFEAVNKTKGILRYAQTLLKLISIKITKNPDCYVLGFRSYEIFWIVKIITFGTPIIFDHMMSPYDSLLNEKKLIKKGGLADRAVYLYEKSVLKYSDIILTDTVMHKEYFTKLFGIDPGKIHAVHVGTDEELFKKDIYSAQKNNGGGFFEVFFYGSLLPLHGVDTILRAAYILKDKPIRFTIIGGNKKGLHDFNKTRYNLELDNVIHKKWIDYERLPETISKADLCLGGPFGGTGQARRIITGKTFQFMAMGRPVIVGEIDTDYGFRDKKNCLLVSQKNEGELADAILWCFLNRDKLKDIGEKGYNLYKNNFSKDKIKESLQVIF